MGFKEQITFEKFCWIVILLTTIAAVIVNIIELVKKW
tara:strand:+ start:207 stop:317 length:111 start_codon:yes stop_codon:yes gene_type:complete